MSIFKADMLVFGGLIAAVIAGCAASDNGSETIVANPTKRWGGVVASGLMNWDYGTGDSKYRGTWLPSEFWLRCRREYASKNTAFRAIPQTIVRVCTEMMEDHGVYGVNEWKLDIAGTPVVKTGATISQVNFLDSSAVAQSVVPKGANMCVIEAAYEQDLGRKAGIEFVWGREPQTAREPNAGFGHYLIAGFVPHTMYPDGVTPLPGYTLFPTTALEGEGDGSFANPAGANITTPGIQPTFFRTPFARISDGFATRILSTPPTNYDYNNFSFMAPYKSGTTFNITSQASMSYWDHNGDIDTSLGIQWAQTFDWNVRGWGPPGTLPTSLWQQMYERQWGYFWMRIYDPEVPVGVRKIAALYGMASTEFSDNKSIPWEPYLRETWRMVSDFIIDQTYCNVGGIQVTDGISDASYSMDIHTCFLFTTTDGVVYRDNGFNNMPGINSPGSPRLVKRYQIPWRSVRSKNSQCNNYITVWGISITHIAFGSYRMEPQTMYCAAACGHIGSRMIQMGLTTGGMDAQIPLMQTELAAKGHVFLH